MVRGRAARRFSICSTRQGERHTGSRTQRGRDMLRRVLSGGYRRRGVAAAGARAARHRRRGVLRRGRALTWISLTGHGREAPEGDWIAFGDDAGVAAGLATVMRHAAGEPVFCGDAIADPMAGMHAALVAWWSHRRGGARRIAFRSPASSDIASQSSGPLTNRSRCASARRGGMPCCALQVSAVLGPTRRARPHAQPVADRAAIRYRRFRISSGRIPPSLKLPRGSSMATPETADSQGPAAGPRHPADRQYARDGEGSGEVLRRLLPPAYGPVFRIKVMGNTYTVLAGAEAANFMGTRAGRDSLRSKEFWQGLVDEWGASKTLTGEDGETHTKLRAVMRHGYSKESVAGRYDELVAITDSVIDRDWPSRRAGAGPAEHAVRRDRAARGDPDRHLAARIRGRHPHDHPLHPEHPGHPSAAEVPAQGSALSPRERARLGARPADDRRLLRDPGRASAREPQPGRRHHGGARARSRSDPGERPDPEPDRTIRCRPRHRRKYHGRVHLRRAQAPRRSWSACSAKPMRSSPPARSDRRTCGASRRSTGRSWRPCGCIRSRLRRCARRRAISSSWAIASARASCCSSRPACRTSWRSTSRTRKSSTSIATRSRARSTSSPACIHPTAAVRTPASAKSLAEVQMAISMARLFYRLDLALEPADYVLETKTLPTPGPSMKFKVRVRGRRNPGTTQIAR